MYYQGRQHQSQLDSFRHHVDEVEDVYDRYSSKSGSKEYDNAFDAADDIRNIVQNVEQEVRALQTKEAALTALKDIARKIIDGPSSTLGSEVRKHYQRDDSIAEAMVRIVRSMTAAERRRVAEGSFSDEMERLNGSAEAYALEMGWEMVLTILQERE